MARIFYMFTGLPGCGKSTLAKKIMDSSADPVEIVERDLIREELGIFDNWCPSHEDMVTAIQTARFHDIMSKGEKDVISSDTNFNPRCLPLYESLCKQYGYILHKIDMTNVPIKTCVEQDAKRTGNKCVGEKVIRDMARRYHVGEYAKFKIPAVPVTDPQSADPDKPYGIIVDLDGTIAKMNGRSPYETTRVYEDLPRPHVIHAVKALYEYYSHFKDTYLLFVSGRDGSCEGDTLRWIIDIAQFDPSAFRMNLWMRTAGDTTRDSIVKNQIFDKHIRGNYQIVGVFDDHEQVIRESWLPKGLPVFNVGDGSIF
jgi:predicted kinase